DHDYLSVIFAGLNNLAVSTIDAPDLHWLRLIPNAGDAVVRHPAPLATPEHVGAPKWRAFGRVWVRQHRAVLAHEIRPEPVAVLEPELLAASRYDERPHAPGVDVNLRSIHVEMAEIIHLPPP